MGSSASTERNGDGSQTIPKWAREGWSVEPDPKLSSTHDGRRSESPCSLTTASTTHVVDNEMITTAPVTNVHVNNSKSLSVTVNYNESNSTAATDNRDDSKCRQTDSASREPAMEESLNNNVSSPVDKDITATSVPDNRDDDCKSVSPSTPDFLQVRLNEIFTEEQRRERGDDRDDVVVEEAPSSTGTESEGEMALCEYRAGTEICKVRIVFEVSFSAALL